VTQCLFDAESSEVSELATRVLVRLASDDDDIVAQSFFGVGDGRIDFDDDTSADAPAARLCVAFEKLSSTMDVRALDFVVALYIESPLAAARIERHVALNGEGRGEMALIVDVRV
jgi:hypothetical protein